MLPTKIARRQFQGWLATAPLLAAGPGGAAAELPLFDAHIRYSHDAWALVPPKQAVALLRQAGLRGALVSPSDDQGTQMLVAEAPDLIVPRSTVALARQHQLLLHAHAHARRRLHRAPAAPVARGAGAVGALGLRPARARARGAAPPPAAVVRPGLPRRPRHAGPGRSGLTRSLHRVSRSFQGRFRDLHARALSIHRRTRPLFPRLAGRPARAAADPAPRPLVPRAGTRHRQRPGRPACRHRAGSPAVFRSSPVA